MQEWIVFVLVAVAASYLLWQGFVSSAARPFANWLLKQGKLKPAFWLRNKALGEASGGGCNNCSPASGSKGCH